MYIGNLNYRIQESDLRAALEEYGAVESVKIVMDRETGRSRGFAFVDMPNDSEASKVIETLNGADFGGRTMVIKEARPRQ
ncbi:MAG: RNA recognition motif domain-containing protein [Bacteroidales bacterium]